MRDIVEIPKKIGLFIENGKHYYKNKQNVLAYTLHMMSMGKHINNPKSELTYKQVKKVTDAVYFGYTTK